MTSLDQLAQQAVFLYQLSQEQGIQLQKIPTLENLVRELGNRLVILENLLATGKGKAGGKGGGAMGGQLMHLLFKSLNVPKWDSESALNINKFKEWSLQVRNYVDVGAPGSAKILKETMILREPIQEDEVGMYDDSGDLDRLLHNLLSSALLGAPLGICRQVTWNSGLEEWRSLHAQYDPMTMEKGVADVMAVLSVKPVSTMSAIMPAIVSWENKMQARADIKTNGSVENMFDLETRRGLLMQHLPPKLYADIDLQGKLYPTYKELRERIQHVVHFNTKGSANMQTDYVEEEDEEYDEEGVPIDALQKKYFLKGKGKGKGKGGKGKGTVVCWRCGKAGHPQFKCEEKDDKFGIVLKKGIRTDLSPRK